VRHNLAQSLGEPHRGLMGNTGKDDVVETLELFSSGANEGGMPVTVKATPPRGDPIDDPPSILKGEEAPLSGDYRERIRRKPRLSIWVPDNPLIARDKRAHTLHPH
jgi:hypothetical protein